MNKAIFTQSSLIRVNLLGVVVIINEHDCLRYADPMQASA